MSENLQKSLEISKDCCRICLKPCSITDWDSTEIADRYKTCMGFEIRAEDQPKKVCRMCVKNLTVVWNFQQQCQLTEQRLIKPELKHEPQIVVELLPEAFKLEPPITENFTESDVYNNQFIADTQDVEEKYYCHICQTTKKSIAFRTKPGLANHMHKIHLKAPPERVTEWVCQHCGQIFNNRSTRYKHILRKHVDPKHYKYECPKCGKKFYKRELLDIHTRRHTGERIFVCEICGSKFLTSRDMRRHKEHIHNKTTAKCCEVCGKTFSGVQYLKQHLQTHNQGCYTCPMCPERNFSLTTTLRSHMKTNHPTFPLPPPGTKLKNFDWSQIMPKK